MRFTLLYKGLNQTACECKKQPCSLLSFFFLLLLSLSVASIWIPSSLPVLADDTPYPLSLDFL